MKSTRQAQPLTAARQYGVLFRKSTLDGGGEAVLEHFEDAMRVERISLAFRVKPNRQPPKASSDSDVYR